MGAIEPDPSGELQHPADVRAIRVASRVSSPTVMSVTGNPRPRSFVVAGGVLLLVMLIGLCLWWSKRISSLKTVRHQPLPDVPVLTNSLGMRFVRIGPGQFMMGAEDSDSSAEQDEKPAHMVVLTREYWLGQFEVTQSEYERVMGRNPAYFSSEGDGESLVRGFDSARMPVEMVRWFDAERYCEKLSLLPAEREAGRTYRLPTEAEWEYACRAGTTSRFVDGDLLSLDAANVKGRWQHPLPVGSYPANPWGLFDMHGNVLEWCADWHEPGYYSRSPGVDPSGPEFSVEDTRVLRGGGWFFKAASSSFRDAISPYFKSPAHGFRVVCEVGENRSPERGGKSATLRD